VARMGEGRGVYGLQGFGREARRDEDTGKPRRSWDGNINMYLREIGMDGAN
jgi:hypothetical protein